ncbi:MAG: hypothetical protein C5B45_05690 [Chlamydiae bacterium]|nr:MAG: hypothetical protein C5B45_05690 [Chlamydiota bacterium]
MKKHKCPKEKRKNPLTKEEKHNNPYLAREHSMNENVIDLFKRFTILSGRYRNRRKRFCLRFNLIAGIYRNFKIELCKRSNDSKTKNSDGE